MTHMSRVVWGEDGFAAQVAWADLRSAIPEWHWKKWALYCPVPQCTSFSNSLDWSCYKYRCFKCHQTMTWVPACVRRGLCISLRFWLSIWNHFERTDYDELEKICNCSLTERDLLKDTSSNGSGGCLRSKAWNMARRRPLKPRSWSMASLLQPPENSLLCRLTKWVRRWGWCREAIGQEVEAWPWLWRFHYHEFDQLDQIWSKRYSWGWQPLECAFELAAWFAAVCSPEVFLERGDLTLEACKSGTSPAKSWYIIMSKWECCLPPRNIPQPLCFWKARPTSLTWGALLKCLTIQHWSSSISVLSTWTPFRSESRRGATHWHRHWWSHMAEKGL